MKTLTILLLTLLGAWEPNFDNAKNIAKRDHKLVLLNFSGSDWCGPCILMEKEYFASAFFQKLAEEKLVMVNADFPRKKKNQLDPAMMKQNEMLAEQYNRDGTFPLTLILDANGKILKTYKGKPALTPEQWVAELKAVCESNL